VFKKENIMKTRKSTFLDGTILFEKIGSNGRLLSGDISFTGSEKTIDKFFDGKLRPLNSETIEE
jgi:hypothetical protein